MTYTCPKTGHHAMKRFQSVCLFVICGLAACKAPDRGTPAPEPAAPAAKQAQAGQANTGVSMPISVSAQLSAAGTLQAEAGDLSLSLTAPACIEQSDTLSLCNRGVELSLSRRDGSLRQTLKPDALYLDSVKTVYRGPLDERFPQGVSLVLADVDGDGHDDLLLWTGKEGAHGAASYDVFLYDAARRSFEFDQEFSDIGIGSNGLFAVRDGRLVSTSTDGCCLHVIETYAIEGGRPKLVERVTQDSTEGQDKVKVRTEKLVDGEMKEVLHQP